MTAPIFNSRVRQRGHLGAGVTGAAQVAAAQPFHQNVGQAGQQQTVLIGPPVVAAGSVREQPLLLLDPVLHVAPQAVAPVIEPLGGARQVGDDIAVVVALMAELRFDDYFAYALLPASCRVPQRRKAALFYPSGLERHGCAVTGIQGQLFQPGVLADTDVNIRLV